MEIQCDVYKSSHKENLFLYVDKSEGLSRVPAELMKQFGEPKVALSFVLTEQRDLAKEDPRLVISNIADQGYRY